MGTEVHLVQPGDGRVVDLGIAQMRLLAHGEATDRKFTLAEFKGGPGPWTVLHVHNVTNESFYVTEGSFTFTVGDREVHATAGEYLMVPPGTPHMISGGKDGGTVLTLLVPGGNEDMFIELSELGSDSITNPQVRAEIAANYDSVPVAR